MSAKFVSLLYFKILFNYSPAASELNKLSQFFLKKKIFRPI